MEQVAPEPKGYSVRHDDVPSKPERPVMLRFAAVTEEIERLDRVVSLLVERIHPALGASHPSEENKLGSNVYDAGNSELVTMGIGMAEQLVRIQAKVNEALERLEV